MERDAFYAFAKKDATFRTIVGFGIAVLDHFQENLTIPQISRVRKKARANVRIFKADIERVEVVFADERDGFSIILGV